jgi:hypothetical protein
VIFKITIKFKENSCCSHILRKLSFATKILQELFNWISSFKIPKTYSFPIRNQIIRLKNQITSKIFIPIQVHLWLCLSLSQPFLLSGSLHLSLLEIRSQEIAISKKRDRLGPTSKIVQEWPATVIHSKTDPCAPLTDNCRDKSPPSSLSSSTAEVRVNKIKFLYYNLSNNFIKGFDSCTTPSQQEHNTPRMRVGPTLMWGGVVLLLCWCCKSNIFLSLNKQ